MSQPYAFFADLAAEVAEQPAGILSRRLHESEHVKAVLFSFAAGEELSEHTAAVPATILTVKGRGAWTVAGQSFEAGPGSWLHLAAKQPHSVTALEPMVMLLLLLKQPTQG